MANKWEEQSKRTGRNVHAKRPFIRLSPAGEHRINMDNIRQTENQRVAYYLRPENKVSFLKRKRDLLNEFGNSDRYTSINELPTKSMHNPQFFFEPQEELPRGMLLWLADYNGSVDMHKLVKGMDWGHKRTETPEGEPAHVVGIYHPTGGASKRFEFYQFEDVTHRMKGEPVPVSQRVKAWEKLLMDEDGERVTLKESKIRGRMEAWPVAKPTEPLGVEPVLPLERINTYAEKNKDDIEAIGAIKLDLARRGMHVDPGSKFGGALIVRPNVEYDPDVRSKITHATTVVVPTDMPGQELPWWSVMGFQRAATARSFRGAKEQIVIPVSTTGKYDPTKEFRYFEIKRIGGARSRPGMYRKVRTNLDRAKIDYKPGWWYETKKNPRWHKTTNQWYFPGPADHHLTKAEREGQWSSFWDAPSHVRKYFPPQNNRKKHPNIFKKVKQDG